MTTPTPQVPYYISGANPQQGDIYSLVTNPMSFYQQRMVLRVRQTVTGTSLPAAGTNTVIAFDTVDEDPYSGWSSGSHSWTPPAGFSGWFAVTISLFGPSNGHNNIFLATSVSMAGFGSGVLGVLPVLGATVPGGVAGMVWGYLIGGQDAVQGFGQIINSAAAFVLGTTTGQQSSMEIIWLF